MQKPKGFTIIELIVVIAIIAVLAAIVLVNVTQYINKGKDASIKGNMANLVTISAAWYDDPTHNKYGGLTIDPTYSSAITSIDSANGTGAVTSQIRTDNTAWCVQSTLNDITVANWCVDSTGYKGNTAACDATNANCN